MNLHDDDDDDLTAAAAAAAAAASCLLRALLGASASVTLLTPAEALRGTLLETGAVSATSPLYGKQTNTCILMVNLYVYSLQNKL